MCAIKSYGQGLRTNLIPAGTVQCLWFQKHLYHGGEVASYHHNKKVLGLNLGWGLSEWGSLHDHVGSFRSLRLPPTVKRFKHVR